MRQNLSELRYLSSAGIRVIIIIMKEMNAKKGKFTIRKISPEVREIFNMTGLRDLFVQDEKYFLVIKETSETKPQTKLTVLKPPAPEE
jgi:anti-anti-sigma regulatory factor